MTEVLVFTAESVTIEPIDFYKFQVTLDIEPRVVVADISVEDRLHDIEPSDIVDEMGAKKLLGAMSEKHFAEWIADHGDFYEALNAIGIERIREWIDDYCSQEDGR